MQFCALNFGRKLFLLEMVWFLVGFRMLFWLWADASDLEWFFFLCVSDSIRWGCSLPALGVWFTNRRTRRDDVVSSQAFKHKQLSNSIEFNAPTLWARPITVSIPISGRQTKNVREKLITIYWWGFFFKEIARCHCNLKMKIFCANFHYF